MPPALALDSGRSTPPSVASATLFTRAGERKQRDLLDRLLQTELEYVVEGLRDHEHGEATEDRRASGGESQCTAVQNCRNRHPEAREEHFGGPELEEECARADPGRHQAVDRGDTVPLERFLKDELQLEVDQRSCHRQGDETERQEP